MDKVTLTTKEWAMAMAMAMVTATASTITVNTVQIGAATSIRRELTVCGWLEIISTCTGIDRESTHLYRPGHPSKS